jgi:hypothetical protein
MLCCAILFADLCEKGDASRSVFLVLSGRCSISIDVERYQMNTGPYTPPPRAKTNQIQTMHYKPRSERFLIGQPQSCQPRQMGKYVLVHFWCLGYCDWQTACILLTECFQYLASGSVKMKKTVIFEEGMLLGAFVAIFLPRAFSDEGCDCGCGFDTILIIVR